jgi:hypothetical protein
VDGVDDLGVVDALQVDRGDAEVAVAQLALDDDQRDALARHLDGMGVTELVRSKPPAHAGTSGNAAKLGADGGARPRSSPRRARDHAEHRPDRHAAAKLEPRLKLFPSPVIHPDFAATPTLATTH